MRRTVLVGGGGLVAVVVLGAPATFTQHRIHEIWLALGVFAIGAIVVAVLAGIVMARSMALPLGRLEATVDRFGHGELSSRANEREGPGEVRSLARQFNHMAGQLDELIEAQQRFVALLLTLLAGVALVLAAIGIYGIVAYSVAARQHEIGIRMALGAERRDVLRLVIRQGLKLALIGVAIGIAGALVLTRFLSSLLYGVKATDPITFIAVSLLLTAVSLLACYIPARRAAKVDPVVALRYE